jgi:hypothetical protein
LPIGLPHRAVLISDQALSSDQGQKFVYVVNAKNKAVYRRVDMGRVHKGYREITAGLKAGEKVIVRGLQRIRRDEVVTPEMVKMPVAAPARKTGVRNQKSEVRGQKSEVRTQRGKVRR